MAIEVKVPDIGADGVEVTEILVEVGDKVEAEQSLVTVEGDKASMGVPSPQTGIVEEIRVSVGDKTQTGALVMIFSSADGAADTASVQAEEKERTAPAAAPAAVAAKDVNVPDIGNDEVKVTEILVKIGDRVKAEQPLITVEDGKTSMEVPAPFTGIVEEIKVSVGDKVSTNSLAMVFEITGEAGATAPAAKQEAAPVATPAPAASMKEINAPDIGGDGVEVTGVMVKMDDKVAVEQPLITVEDDKASVEVPAPFAGVVRKLKVNVDDKVKTSSLIMIFEVESAAPAAALVRQETAAPAPTAEARAPAAAPVAKAEDKSEFTENDAYVHAAPLIRHLAREFDVNLAKVKGVGRKGRTLCEDVRAYVKEAIKRVETAPAATGGGVPGILLWPKVDFSKFGEIEEVELGRIQKSLVRT